MKIIIRLFNLILSFLFTLIFTLMFIINLSYIISYCSNYVEEEAVIIEYKNSGSNYSINAKSSFSLFAEYLIFGYYYNGIYYEDSYLTLIGDEHNNFEVNSKTKVMINPNNPEDFVWKKDKSFFKLLIIEFLFILVSGFIFYKNYKNIVLNKVDIHIEN